MEVLTLGIDFPRILYKTNNIFAIESHEERSRFRRYTLGMTPNVLLHCHRPVNLNLIEQPKGGLTFISTSATLWYT
jgi:hypothetical protein